MQQKSPALKRYLWFAALVGLMIIITLILRGYAMYLRSAEEMQNTFKPAASVEPPVEETFEPGDTVKSDVKIAVDEPKNRTEYPVYVRVAVVITWQRIETDEDGNETVITYFEKPQPDTDYSIELNLTDWTLNKEDNYYYFNYIVPSGGKTTNLINECKALKSVTDMLGNTYTLSVNIIPQTVQAVGLTDDGEKKAVEDAWGWENAPTGYAPTQSPAP